MSTASLVTWDGEVAWRNVLGSPVSRWHAERRSRHWSGTAAERLERALVLPETSPGFRFGRDARLFAIGSCFARHIENYLLKHGYDVPSGHIQAPGLEAHPGRHATVVLNKFTTHSMLNELRWALEPGCAFPEDSLVEEGAGFVDLQMVGEVAPAPRDVVLARRPCVAEVFRRVRACHVVVLTLGLVEAWFDREQGLYLNRAPGYRLVKRQAGRFELRLLDHAANLEALEQIHALLRTHCRDDLRVVVSVSPVPLSETFTGRDVLVANAYSKAVLRAVAEHFARRHERVDYYPSYESVTLSDRRVAFQDDLHHVADAVVDLNVRRFLDLYAADDAGAEAREADAQRHVATRLARVQDDALAENARLRAELADLRAELRRRGLREARERFAGLAGLDADGRARGVDGRRLPAPARLSGAVEVGVVRDDGRLAVSGWVVDLTAPDEALLVVVLVDGQPHAFTRTAIERADVGQALGVAATRPGFEFDLGAPAREACVRVLAFDALGAAAELHYDAAGYRLRRA